MNNNVLANNNFAGSQMPGNNPNMYFNNAVPHGPAFNANFPSMTNQQNFTGIPPTLFPSKNVCDQNLTVGGVGNNYSDMPSIMNSQASRTPPPAQLKNFIANNDGLTRCSSAPMINSGASINGLPYIGPNQVPNSYTGQMNRFPNSGGLPAPPISQNSPFTNQNIRPALPFNQNTLLNNPLSLNQNIYASPPGTMASANTISHGFNSNQGLISNMASPLNNSLPHNIYNTPRSNSSAEILPGLVAPPHLMPNNPLQYNMPTPPVSARGSQQSSTSPSPVPLNGVDTLEAQFLPNPGDPNCNIPNSGVPSYSVNNSSQFTHPEASQPLINPVNSGAPPLHPVNSGVPPLHPVNSGVPPLHPPSQTPYFQPPPVSLQNTNFNSPFMENPPVNAMHNPNLPSNNIQPMNMQFPGQNFGNDSGPSPSDGITGKRQYPPQMPYFTPNTSNNTSLSNQMQNMNISGSDYMKNINPASTGIMSNVNYEGRIVNLLQERTLIPRDGIETVKPSFEDSFKKAVCNPKEQSLTHSVFRCTLTNIPKSSSLLHKCKLPFGILMHPFKDLAHLPVMQSNVIVRCRMCRTYINPYVTFIDMKRWKCNLCYKVNELPDEFNFDPVSKTYGEPQRRPEIKSATIEYIAPSEYMLRPPQPAIYLYLLDVSYNAVQTGYLSIFCQTLIDEIDRIPGDSRSQIGFITFDSSLHFYSMPDDASRPQMMVVSDIEEIFIPSPGNLLVNLQDCKELVLKLLSQIPQLFEHNLETGSALGPALQAAYKMTAASGGRVSVFQTVLPSIGEGSLKNREDPNERASKNVCNLGPATDFYKKLSLECSAQQIAMDLFLMNTQYIDLSSIGCISKYSGGSIHHFPGFSVKNNREVDTFTKSLRRYITRKIGFEAVMRVRCTRGLGIHAFHGNFFVRSTDLLSLPNVNPESGFGMQIGIEESLESQTACFQAALLYTSSKGERRIRVHTLCLPVTTAISEVHRGADQMSTIALLSKMAVDKSLSHSMSDARDAIVNASIDLLNAYGNTLTTSQRMGQLPLPYSLRLIPLLTLGLMKFKAFRTGASVRLDDRVFALEQCKSLPVDYIIQEIYPSLYPVHKLHEQGETSDELVIPKPPVIQLSYAHIDAHGVYLLDGGSKMLLFVGASVGDIFCRDVLNIVNQQAVPDIMTELPELDNSLSIGLRNFIQYLNEQKPYPASLKIIKQDGKSNSLFSQYMIEDKTESSMSYYEYLQHLQKEVKI